MRTTLATLALAIIASAHAQTGTTTMPVEPVDQNAPAGVPTEQPAIAPAAPVAAEAPAAVTPPVAVTAPVSQAAKRDCLLDAGPYVWAELGLSADQVQHMSDLQARYKAQLAPVEEKVTDKKKGKKSDKKEVAQAKAVVPPAAVAAESAAGPVPQDKEGIGEQRAEVSATEQRATLSAKTEQVKDAQVDQETATRVEQNDAQAVAADVAAVPTLTITEELHTILTPEQVARWEKQCPQMELLQPTSMIH